jgi:arylsulfatase A-like enzyme
MKRKVPGLGRHLLALAALAFLGATTPATAEPLNFLFFLADDLGWRDLGCQGSTFYETPNLDRLAASGMRFTDAYSACQVCSPTRAAIMTGKYPARTGVTDYIGAAQPEKWSRPTKMLPAPYANRLALNEVTLAEALKTGGYATFFAGKWHLGPQGWWPENQGFDVNKGGCAWGHPVSYFSPYKNPRLEDGPDGEHLPDRLAQETVKFIEANRERPFFAYLSFYSVHTPLQSRADLQAKYEAKAKQVKTDGAAWGDEGERKVRRVQDHAIYAGMVEAMDLAVGKVLNAVERLGLAGRTVVVFTSDNGGLSTSEGSPTSNVPLRAGKGWFYEGGIRVSLVVRAPGVTRSGAICAEPVFSADFYPTFLALAGLTAQPAQHTDGVSFVPLLKQQGKLKREAIYWHYPHYGNQGGSPGSAVRMGDWKLIEFAEDNRVELYNLRDDLGETRNLALKEKDRVAAMQRKLHAWQREVGARFPTPNTKPAQPSGEDGKARKKKTSQAQPSVN